MGYKQAWRREVMKKAEIALVWMYDKEKNNAPVKAETFLKLIVWNKRQIKNKVLRSYENKCSWLYLMEVWLQYPPYPCLLGDPVEFCFMKEEDFCQHSCNVQW